MSSADGSGVEDLLREQLRWIKASAIGEVRRSLLETLDPGSHRRAYEAMDGTRTQREIADEAGVGTGSVSVWGRSWKTLGLVFDNPEGRLEHLSSLENLGVSVENDQI